ncbi:MAG: hypothetical protein M3Z20_16500 [Chloroflexota bacterium]|nr:hypothetical protein [Chloroflexota bacterium]
MNLVDEFMSPERQWQINENLKLARQFIQEYFDNPETIAGLGPGEAIVLLPSDEPGEAKLTHANLRMAHQMALQGRSVATFTVGARPPGPPVHFTSLEFAREPSRVQYNPETDALTVTFDEPSVLVGFTAIHPRIDAIFDPETHDLMQMIVRHFTSDVALSAPQLLDAILRSSAELSGISREALQALRHDAVTADGAIQASLARNTA